MHIPKGKKQSGKGCIPRQNYRTSKRISGGQGLGVGRDDYAEPMGFLGQKIILYDTLTVGR